MSSAHACLIRRIATGEYVREWQELDGYRHVETVADPAKAMQFDPDNVGVLCDRTFDGEQVGVYRVGDPTFEPEYERVPLPNDQAHRQPP